jgi:NitT/TauT family transport system substrate-binding protein
MIFRAAAVLFAVALSPACAVPAAAQERVSVATMRSSANGALFLAAARGYFKAEGITLDMTAYGSDADVVKAMASGASDFGLANWSVETVKLASGGAFKAVAAQLHEKDGYEGNEIVVSSIAYDRGVHKLDDVLSGIVVVDQVGSTLHYQLEQARHAKGANITGFTVKFAGSRAAAALAISDRRADIAVLPMLEARNLLATNQARLVAWCSQVAETELGALFASRNMLAARRGVAEKFIHAYRRGADDYFKAFLRLDKYSKRISNAQSLEAAKILAFYVYPRATLDTAMANVEGEIHYMDARAQIDTADLARRLAWYHSEGMIDKTVDARALVDLSFK